MAINSEIKYAKECHNIMFGNILLDVLIKIYYILLNCQEKKFYLEINF